MKGPFILHPTRRPTKRCGSSARAESRLQPSLCSSLQFVGPYVSATTAATAVVSALSSASLRGNGQLKLCGPDPNETKQHATTKETRGLAAEVGGQGGREGKVGSVASTTTQKETDAGETETVTVENGGYL